MGQKLIILVSTNIPARTKSIMPNVPEIVPVKNRTPIIAAIIILITLSAVPIFFFIVIAPFYISLC